MHTTTIRNPFRNTPRLSISLLPPHINHLQRRIPQLHDMPRLECFGVDVVDVVGMEDTRFSAAENGLFPRGIGEAEAAPARRLVLALMHLYRGWIRARKKTRGTYSGVLLGAQTIAILSAIIT
jgi:hypothetical protein